MRISDWSSDVCSSDLQRFENDGACSFFCGLSCQACGASAGAFCFECCTVGWHFELVPLESLISSQAPVLHQRPQHITHCINTRRHLLALLDFHLELVLPRQLYVTPGDRKSQRLNSSH